MYSTMAIFASSEGWKLIPAMDSHRREPLTYTPTPGMITSTSSTALSTRPPITTQVSRQKR